MKAYASWLALDRATLSAEDLTYIIEHADDRVIFVDPDQVATLEKLAPALARVRHIVVLGAEVTRGPLLDHRAAPSRPRYPPHCAGHATRAVRLAHRL